MSLQVKVLLFIYLTLLLNAKRKQIIQLFWTKLIREKNWFASLTFKLSYLEAGSLYCNGYSLELGIFLQLRNDIRPSYLHTGDNIKKQNINAREYIQEKTMLSLEDLFCKVLEQKYKLYHSLYANAGFKCSTVEKLPFCQQEMRLLHLGSHRLNQQQNLLAVQRDIPLQAET